MPVFSARESHAQARPGGFDGIGLVGVLAHDLLEDLPRLHVAELLIALCHADERLGGNRAILTLSDLLVLLDGASKIAFDCFLIHRRLENGVGLVSHLCGDVGASDRQHSGECDERQSRDEVFPHSSPLMPQL